MSAEPTQVNRPVLRYHGGKWLLAPWILEFFPPHRIYVESFGGAASILMRKPRCYAEVYNDLDGEIVNVFKVLRNSEAAADLQDLLRNTPFARTEFLESYQPSDEPIEQARRTITRSFMGFGSPAASGHKTGFRSNSNRSGTTPARDWVNYAEECLAYTERLRGVCIESRPAIDVILQHDTPETLHYVDPPYVADTRNQGNPYCKKGSYRHELTDEDHRELAQVLSEVTGMVVLSGYPSELYDNDLYSDWHRFERTGSFADGARIRTEVLWLNDAATEALERSRQQQRLY